MQPCWRSQWRKCLWSHVNHFKMGEKKKFRANHSMNAPSVAAIGPMTDLETLRQGCPVCPCHLVVLLLYRPLFLFQKAALQWLISSGRYIILALKALCKVRGGPLWCLTAPAESDPVLPLGCTGRAALLIPAELWDLYQQAEIYSYISENISHITCIFDMILSIWYHLNLPGDSWHLGTSSSTDHFKYPANVKEPVESTLWWN